MIYVKRLIFITLIAISCQSLGQLQFLADITNSLEEVSAVEIIPNSDLFWTIQDSGNDSKLYGLDTKGNISQEIIITNVSNIDWEDLTSDKLGNLYIGDFGNNNEKRKHFRILKVNFIDLSKKNVESEIIEFTLPEKQDSKDFESFFLLNDNFYLFSKETKKFIVLSVPNKSGKHVARLVTTHNLDGKHNRITSADISSDGSTIVLLNHDKLWKLSKFKSNDFFNGKIEEQSFDHNTQKEGICFRSKTEIIITDERKGSEGGNIYGYILE